MRLLFSLALAGSFAMPATAQQICAQRDEIMSALSSRYSEETRIIASNEKAMFEFVANEETGTWTIIYTRPDGITCVAATGEGLQFIAPGDPT